MSSTTLSVRRGVDAAGEVLSESVLLERVRALASSTTRLANKGLEEAWSESGLDAIAVRTESFASVAWERAFGRLHPDGDLHLDSRAVRIAQARAGEALRGCAYSREIITSLLAGEGAPGADRVSVRNARREIVNAIGHRRRTGAGDAVPGSFLEVRPRPPRLPVDVIPLGPTDAQFASWEQVGGGQAVLRVKLPLTSSPASRRDWQWHRLVIELPASVRREIAYGADLLRPTLRVRKDAVLIDLAAERPVPEAPAGNTWLALDWGERRLLTGAIVTVSEDGSVHSDGRPLFFRSRAVQGKLARLRAGAQSRQGKLDRIGRLLEGRDDARLRARRELLEAELELVWARYSNLSHQLAHAASRWATEQARLHGCTGVIMEDLASLEARFRGRPSLNRRINSQVRGRLSRQLAHKLEAHGLRFETVHARGTSSHCPRCRRRVARHVKAPDDARRGRGWLTCSCGHSADRDHAAAECIGARFLGDDAGVRHSRKPRVIRHARPRPRTTRKTSSCSRARRGSARRSVSAGAWPRGSAQALPQPVGAKSPVAVSNTGARSRSCAGFPARDLNGLRHGFTGTLHFTPTRLPRESVGASTRTRHPPRPKKT